MNREDKNFSEQLRMWRKSRGLNQTQAGKVLGVSVNTIGHWEGGKVPSERLHIFLESRYKKRASTRLTLIATNH